MFVLPQGSTAGCIACTAGDGKVLVRMLYRYAQSGNLVEPLLFDFSQTCHRVTFFVLALYLNERDGIDEIPFISRNYR